MREIINYEEGKTISVLGDGIDYTLSFPFKIELKITKEEITDNININLDRFLDVEPGSRNFVDSFKDHLKSGYLTLDDYKWINRWSDTEKFGAGKPNLNSLEFDIFGFKLEKKVDGLKEGIKIYSTPEQIFNLFVVKALDTFR